jgi:DNA polymerase I
MERLVFDLETNGLLPEVSTIHCLVIRNIDTDEVETYTSDGVDGITSGLSRLQYADVLIGHNIIKYDIPVIIKLHPWFQNVLDHPNAPILMDTLVLSRLIWPEIRNDDFRLREKRPEFPTKMIGRHSLESWGHRLGNHKGDYDGGWEKLNQEMVDYCIQDTKVTALLWNLIQTKEYSDDAIILEHDFVKCIQKQEQFGFVFNEDKAGKLYIKLGNRKREIVCELRKSFSDWEIHTPFTPKVNSKKFGYKKGVPTVKVKKVIFNPSSRDHIAHCLTKKYNWKPKQFTQEGKPQVDESVLNSLPYPEAKLLAEYLMLDKRLGMIGEGRQAWLKLVTPEGKIHGTVTTNGAVTGRCTHQRPNVAQVPSMKVDYGKECRELFTVPDGYSLVGADASGIELRCLAHYMAKYDGGSYVKELLEGDIHSANQKAAGLPTRDNAKTFIYAYLYGAGDAKIGSIVGGNGKEGRKLKNQFLKKTPALKQLRETVVETLKKKGYLKGIDGRILSCRSEHSALNTLLQSAGGLLVKTATVILHRMMKDEYQYGTDWAMVAHVHDEMQLQVRSGLEKTVGAMAVNSIVKAGEQYNFRCPLDGEFKIGANWAETH